MDDGIATDTTEIGTIRAIIDGMGIGRPDGYGCRRFLRITTGKAITTDGASGCRGIGNGEWCSRDFGEKNAFGAIGDP